MKINDKDSILIYNIRNNQSPQKFCPPDRRVINELLYHLFSIFFEIIYFILKALEMFSIIKKISSIFILIENILNYFT